MLNNCIWDMCRPGRFLYCKKMIREGNDKSGKFKDEVDRILEYCDLMAKRGENNETK
jgi:hypothetical protein